LEQRKWGRPIGTYITIESPPLKINDPYVDEIVKSMEKSMHTLIGDYLKPQDTVLLVGLGNWRAVADALALNLLNIVLLHDIITIMLPDALVQGMRPTCGIAPGVLGITGLETYEVIKGIVEKIKPALLVVVDALAAQNVQRIGCSIQMSNTGIQPGSGVGNARHAIRQEDLGEYR
jgi:spore protease